MENGYLLISDVDGTLLGDGCALAEFARWYESQRGRLRLVYNSGRFVRSVLDSVESTDLPEPDAVIGGVGTEIECFATRTAVGNWFSHCEGWQPLRICSVLARYDELELQPAHLLSDYKISYYVRGASVELIEEIRRRLAAASCHVELVYSSNRDLDVLPSGVNKGSAAAFLASHWSYGSEGVIVSGDTTNDLAMFAAGFRGIVVGNADGELKRLDSPMIYQAARSHAAGVREGLAHWFATDRERRNPTLLNHPVSFK